MLSLPLHRFGVKTLAWAHHDLLPCVRVAPLGTNMMLGVLAAPWALSGNEQPSRGGRKG